MDKKLITVLLLLDFSKAFDSVDHRILFRKLQQEFNFENSAIALIMNYLSERMQTVCVDGEFSGFLPLLKGVPQGTVVGPLLFSLFINNIPECLKYMMYHIFADDVQIYRSFKLSETMENLKKSTRILSLFGFGQEIIGYF